MTLIAIDPGEVHTGIAVMEVYGKVSIWRTGALYSEKDHLRPVSILDRVLKHADRPIMALEDFRLRPIGHQSMTRGLTVRLIGAIEYVASTHGVPTYFFQPGNIERDLKGFGLDKLIDQWNWPKNRYLEHARSAWRIMGHLILHQYPQAEVHIRPTNDMLTGVYAPDDWAIHLDDERDIWIPPVKIKL